MYDRLAAAILGLTSGAAHQRKVQDLTAHRPGMRSLKRKGVFEKLHNATNEIGRERLGDSYKEPQYVPMAPPSTVQAAQNATTAPQTYAQSVPSNISVTAPGLDYLKPDTPTVLINPNVDRVYGAKALGQMLSQQTALGKAASNTRQAIMKFQAENPKLAKAMIIATGAAPAVYSAATPGDEDTDEALALAMIPALPALVDESLHTGHAINIHNKAGLRMNMGQRGKLAGNLLSYLAPAVIAGSAGNMIGNILDEDVPASL